MTSLRRQIRAYRKRERAEIAELRREADRAERFLDEISAMLDPEDGKAPSPTQGGPA